MGFIYKISNTVNSKKYIGLTTNSIEHRFKQHKYKSKTSDYLLYMAMRKYGVDKFYIEQIEECDNTLLKEKERYWIDYYDSYNNGYNMTPGGDSNEVFIDDSMLIDLWESGLTISDISIQTGHSRDCIVRHLKNNNVYNADEAIARGLDKSRQAKIKQVFCYDLKGKLLHIYNSVEEISAELNLTERTIRRYCRDKKILNNKIYSYQEIIEEDLLIYYKNSRGQGVIQYDKNGKFVNIFSSITEATKATNIQNISKICKEKKGSAGGYQWRYLNDNPPEPLKEHTKKVSKYTKDWVYIETYNSVLEAALKNHISSSSNINSAIKRNGTCGGYRWKYEDNNTI